MDGGGVKMLQDCDFNFVGRKLLDVFSTSTFSRHSSRRVT